MRVAPEIKALATPRYLERARLLGAMMRVVYLLTASMPGVMPKLKWEKRDNGALALVIPASRAGTAAASGRRAAWRNSPRCRAASWNWSSPAAEPDAKKSPGSRRAFFIIEYRLVQPRRASTE